MVAQTEKTKAEAENIAGVERENVATQTLELKQGIKNKEAQQEYRDWETDRKSVV